MKNAWSQSKDRTTNAGRPGIDNISAEMFAANLDSNLIALAKDIRSGNYGPSSLKAVFLPKPNSSKERMICIPTVKDRLVQRVIVDHLTKTEKLPIYNLSSFGFIKGKGASKAIEATRALRAHYPWCLKTDIEKFFDSIPRPHLKSRVQQTLGRSSLTPIISKVIDCEVKLDPRTRVKIREQGIMPGVGLRQGMPLSPILANLVLSKFDREIERANIPMVRYADDLILFFENESDAKSGHRLVKEALASIELKIPEIADNSKTAIAGPKHPIDFLGREIIFFNEAIGYVSGISTKQVQKIRKKLESDYTYLKQSKDQNTLQDSVVDLWRSVSAYRGIYKDAYNFDKFDSELRNIGRGVISQMFSDIFGTGALEKLDNYKRNFLGIGHLNIAPALNDLEQD